MDSLGVRRVSVQILRVFFSGVRRDFGRFSRVSGGFFGLFKGKRKAELERILRGSKGF